VQLINFGIFFLVFWKFVLPRLRSFMDARAKGIKDSLQDAERASQEAEEAEAKREQTLAAATREADQLLADAREQAAEQTAAALEQSRQEAARVIEDGKAQLEAERTKLRAELRAELSGLTVTMTKKVLEGMVGKAEHQKMVKQAEKAIAGKGARVRR
jgi:F-type H+-transporting ATPase subunit b